MTRQEHAAKRYSQIQQIERDMSRKQGEIVAAKDHVKELQEEYRGLQQAMRAAARDEGELPLFDSLEDAPASEPSHSAEFYDAVADMVPDGTTCTISVDGMEPVTLNAETSARARAKARAIRAEARAHA